MSATRESILGHRRKPVETVDVEEWGGTVHLTPMSGADRHSFFQRVKDEEEGTAALAVRTVTDEHGTRLFTDAEAAEVAKAPATLLDRIAPALLRVNGMGAAADAKKNSTPES